MMKEHSPTLKALLTELERYGIVPEIKSERILTLGWQEDGPVKLVSKENCENLLIKQDDDSYIKVVIHEDGKINLIFDPFLDFSDRKKEFSPDEVESAVKRIVYVLS